MTYTGDPTSARAWLAAHPGILRDNPPSDLTRCACGGRHELVALVSPSGDYAVCCECLGGDTAPRGPRTPTTIPTTKRKAT